MPEKDPANWTALTWVLAFLMPICGGIVNWYSRVRSGHTRVFNIVELIGEIFTSGFVGFAVFLAMSSLEQPTGLSAAAAGIGGHMATRLLFAVERAGERIIDSWGDRFGGGSRK